LSRDDAGKFLGAYYDNKIEIDEGRSLRSTIDTDWRWQV
jgi:hypothetical protein